MGIEIHSVKDFEDFLREQNIPGLPPVFRGHEKNDYLNTPTICHDKLTSELSPKETLLFDQKILEKLRASVDVHGFIGSVQLHPGFGTPGHLNDWLLLAQARHYGMPSRLQDWSVDSQIGLYFTVNNPCFHNEPGHVWILRSPLPFVKISNPKFGIALANRFLHINADEDDRSLLDAMDPFEIEKTTLFDIAHFFTADINLQIFEVRRWSQGGMFIISKQSLIKCPLDKQFVVKLLMRRVEIPASAKSGILEELIKRNIHEKTILPPIPDETKEILEGIKNKALIEVKSQINQ